MENRRIYINKKSIGLFILCIIMNSALFYYNGVREYTPLSRNEIVKIDYEEKVNQIQKQIQQNKSVAIFQEEDEEVFQQKTWEDYKRIENVKGTTNAQEGISLWFSWSLQKYIMLFFCVWIIFMTFDTEKKGLFALVCATPKGRAILMAKRLIGCFGAVLLMSFVLNGLMLLQITIKVQDISAFFQPIQLVTGLESCILPTNGLGFVLWNIFFQAIRVYAVTLVCWLIFLWIRNSKFALTACGILFATEYYLSKWILAQSQWNMWKYINIMTFLDAGRTYVEYRLIKVGLFCMEKSEWVLFSAGISILVLSIVCLIFVEKRRPIYKKNILEKGIDTCLCLVRRSICHLPSRFLEWHKVLIAQKVILILPFFLLLFTSNLWLEKEQGKQLMIGGISEYMEDFYREYTGEITDSVVTEMDRREKEIVEMLESGNPTVTYYIKGLQELEKRVKYVENKKEKKLWLVNPSGYRLLFGEKGEETFGEQAILFLFAILIVVSGIFSFEKKSGMESLLHTTKYGGKHLERRKYLISTVICFILCLSININEIYSVSQMYLLKGWNAPIESLPFMKNCLLSLGVGEYYVLVLGCRFLGSFVCMLIFIEITKWCGKQESSIFVGAIIILPSLLYQIGLTVFSKYSVIKILHVSHFLRQGRSGIEKLIFVMGVGIFLLVLSSWGRRKYYVRN